MIRTIPVLLAASLLVSVAGLSVGCSATGSGETDRLRDEIRSLTAHARDKVFPALVNIRVVTVSYYGGQENKGGGSGSGTIISPLGYVVTNAHVTGDGKRYFCTLADKQEISATLVGEDIATDLAVLKLNLNELKPGTTLSVASWGDSDELQVGDNVLAMGSPFSLSRSVTLGIVSNTSRVFTAGFGSEDVDEMQLDYGQSTGSFTRWIQHDALINPGNSGGPLVNMRGEIVGVNTRGGSGMGFASPAVLVRDVVSELIAKGEVVRSNVGMSFKAISKTGIKEGVLVNSVNKDGPAAKAGMKAGDVIVKVDGSPLNVRFAEEIPPLLKQLSSVPVGGTIKFTVVRGAETLDYAITTDKLLREIGDETLLRGWGLSIAEITETIARNRRLSSREGVLITGAKSGSPAELAELKIQGGDILKEIDGKPVKTFKDAVDLYRAIMTVDSPDKLPEFVMIRIDRRGQDQVTLIKPRPPKKEDEAPELPKAWLGVESQPVYRDLAKRLSTDGAAETTAGFRITRVYAGTLAATAGLKPGDIITAINGERLSAKGIQDAGQLQRKLRTFRPDDKIKITVLRDGKPEILDLALEKTRLTAAEAKRDDNKDFELSVREITFFDREDEQWDETVQGVLVTNVEQVGWAGLAGLQSGDLIQRIADTEIKNVADFRAVMARLAKDQPERVVFVVLRYNRTAFLFAEPEWKPQTKTEAKNEAKSEASK